MSPHRNSTFTFSCKQIIVTGKDYNNNQTLTQVNNQVDTMQVNEVDLTMSEEVVEIDQPYIGFRLEFEPKELNSQE